MAGYDGPSSIDWKTEIVIGVLILQRMSEVDYENLWEYHLPEVRATIEQVESTEEKLGFRLPEDYRTFLLHANGWKYFSQSTNILPLNDLVDTSSVYRDNMDNLRLMLEYEPAEGEWLDPEKLLPITHAEDDISIFAMIKPGNPDAGTVIWLRGGEIERYPSFYEFYLSMLDYNRREIRIFEKQAEERKNDNKLF